MKKLGLIMVLAGVGVLAAGCNVGVRETDEDGPPPATPGGPTPGASAGAPGGDYPGPCPVGTWQLSGIEPGVGVGIGAGELSFAGGGSMVLGLADDGTWTVADDGSHPLDATVVAGDASVAGTATIEGSAEGRYANQGGDNYLFEDDRSDGTVELSAPGYSETLGMDDVLAAIVPTGQAQVICSGNTLTISGTHATWQFVYLGSGSSSEGTVGTDEESTAITELTAGGTYDCEGGSVRVTQVAGLLVQLTGDCATVYVDSTGNNVEVESADMLVVTGAANTVDIQQVNEIQVTGAMSRITWHGDEPQISNSAVGATVQEG